jgi:hypothetical protein
MPHIFWFEMNGSDCLKKLLLLLLLAGFLVLGTVELKGNNSVSEATTTSKMPRARCATNSIKKATTIVNHMTKPRVVNIASKQKAVYSAATIKSATVTTKPVVIKTTVTTKKIAKVTRQSSVTVSRGNSRSDIEATIKEVGSGYWTDTGELDALIWVNKHESVRPGIVSKGGCKGLFQLKNPPKWMVLGDPASETKAGCEYIKRRYKTPSRAKAFWQSHHWY